MDTQVVFSYTLVSTDDQALEEKVGPLRAVIQAHSRRHDFAQRIHVEEVDVAEVNHGEAIRLAVIVPFHREHFQELATLNHYMMARAREVGLKIIGLLLPDGSCLPLDDNG